MRGASTARALLTLYRRSSPSSLSGSARSASTISSGTACVTIETTTRLGLAKSDSNHSSLLKALTLAHPQTPATAPLLGFEKLGLSPTLSEAAKGLGVLFPSEIHCASIPEILRGKSVLITSHFDSVGSFSLGIFSYLLPLLQRLKRGAKFSGADTPNCPRAVVLLSSKELAEEFLRVSEIILEKLRLPVENGQPESKNSWDVSTGLLVGTPDEVLRKIESGDVVPSEIKYLVVDEVDDMFNNNLGSDIQKISSQLKEVVSSTPGSRGLQTILVTSMITKILREEHSSIVEHMEQNCAEVSGMLVELDQTEAFHLLESPEALKQKAVEVILSLQPGSGGC